MKPSFNMSLYEKLPGGVYVIPLQEAHYAYLHNSIARAMCMAGDDTIPVCPGCAYHFIYRNTEDNRMRCEICNLVNRDGVAPSRQTGTHRWHNVLAVYKWNDLPIDQAFVDYQVTIPSNVDPPDFTNFTDFPVFVNFGFNQTATITLPTRGRGL